MTINNCVFGAQSIAIAIYIFENIQNIADILRELSGINEIY